MTGNRRLLLLLAAAIFAAAFVSCRSTLRGAPLAPLRASSPDEAFAQLRARAASFSGARSLMRIRATVSGRTQSFRAQLVIPDRDSMELIAYTPVGTTAVTIRATGDQINFVNHVENSSWQGSPEELARSLSMYATHMLPSEMAMLLIGLPVRDDLAYTPTPAGLLSASADDVTVAFDPPQFPPSKVTVRRGNDVVEIQHLQIVSMK